MTPRNKRWTNNVPRPHHANVRHGMSDSGSRHNGRSGEAPRGQGEGSYVSGWGLGAYRILVLERVMQVTERRLSLSVASFENHCQA